MNREEFMSYLHENYNVSIEVYRLIDNILGFVENHAESEFDCYPMLCELLDCTIGLSDNEIKQINLW